MEFSIFFHPDYTVGTGITPDHALRLADSTAGRELHPALKINVLYQLAVYLTSPVLQFIL